MNAIILSALCGVVMMFSGILLKNKSAIKYVAIAALLVLIIGYFLHRFILIGTALNFTS